ncbi:MAG: DUF3426 domain-containing protein, partial [Desulfuromonadales bacterium]|nr:DUF3426 domain-containing protein [Desulfuromonadales bacterium]NIR33742.1 DUF3426 domain-containing protein [Desulfuromonadales bacterium]NIS43738.1 DUF3426 domain-containing protein [Desulfuromonadales bacterium]
AFSGEQAEEKEDSSFGFGEEETSGEEETGFEQGEESAGPTEFEFDAQASSDDFGFDADSIGDEFEFDETEGEGAGDEFELGDAGTEPDAFDFGGEDPFAEEDSAATQSGGEEKEFKFTELPTSGEGDSSPSAAPGGSFAPPAPKSSMSETGYFGEEPFPEETPAAPPASAGKGRKKARAKKRERKGSPLSRVLLLVFLLLVVLLGGVGYLYWQQGAVGLPAVDDLISRLISSVGGEPQTEGSLEIAEQSGRYVTNRLAGTLLVIEGRTINGYPSNRANLRVQAVLYDAGGRALRKQNAYCGNRLTDEQLRNLPFAKIEESMNNAFGEALSNTDVPPGKGLPFTVVFRDLPENLDSFSVDGLDSQPASAQ